MPKITPNRLAALICIYFIGLGITYSAKTALFEGPDELAHFVYINRIITLRQLNVISPDRFTMQQDRNYEAHQHPLYYLASVPLALLFERDDVGNYTDLNPFASIGIYSGANENVQLHPLEHTGDTVYAVWAIRMFSLFMGTVTLLCIYHVSRIVWDEGVGLAAMLVTASIPMFVHISVSINNDNLSIVMNALATAILVQAWRDRSINRTQAVLLGMAAVAAVLAKLTGIIAYGYGIGALILGGYIGRFAWRQVRFALLALLVTFLVFGLWWFVRNIVVYGDPLGLNATLDLWASNRNRLPSWDRIHGIWVSFWMMLGHLNIPGPAWLIPYTYTVTALAIVGVAVNLVRNAEMRWYILFLLAVQAMSWAVVIYISRSINLFQGRALFMGLVTFGPLLVIGWRTLLGRLYAVPALPLVTATVMMPFTAIAPAYDLLDVRPDDTLPVEATRIDARAETITVHGYELLTDAVEPGGEIALDLYFSGGSSADPIVFVTAQHPVTKAALGSVNTYPGMVATRRLSSDETYRTRLRLRLDEAPANSGPFQVELALGWRTVNDQDRGQGRYLPWVDANDNPIGGVFLAGPVYSDDSYTPPQMATSSGATFGGAIALRGYTVESDGSDVRIRLLWERIAPISADYVLTVGLLDESNTLIAQQDAPPPGYPTSVWVDAQPYLTEHVLTIPEAAEGDLRLRVGWYLSETFERLDASGETVLDGMLVLPVE
ncbi:MAG: glycosyltransferase family 39 protein [Chloroflexota bacterium]